MACTQCKETNFLVYILIILFGAGSWIAVNGIWVELPLMVPQLPESWRLPSFLTVLIQVANIGPIAITVANHFAKDRINENVLIYTLLFVDIVACLLLAFFWKTTSVIAGELHSTFLLTIAFFLALVSCSSSVLFLPFMALFKDQYITAFFIGQGMSGLFPSIVALGQGVGKLSCVNVSIVANTTINDTLYDVHAVYEEPKFPVENFIFFIFTIMIVCSLAFTALLYLPYCKSEYAEEKPKEMGTINAEEKLMETTEHNEKQQIMSPVSKVMIYLLALNAWINFLENGILLPTQTYSCLPYGNEVYHLTVTLVNIADPLSSLASFIFPSVTRTLITSLTFAASGMAGYTLYIAAKSPTPILMSSIAGPIVIVSIKTNYF